ncbi:hypothetical protein [Hymenobacter metallicola]|uniref:Uncharacterized protein n=1 Tax=Hymenobacter metallicola TaxID=2563114 RepID=A0A4Z0QIE0_9BACT|nr:hypothetical protein [Hymenobacter metallicola]TGE29848.1 hypothetical protein E5K02_10415 [Hymenobacter metallicola]
MSKTPPDAPTPSTEPPWQVEPDRWMQPAAYAKAAGLSHPSAITRRMNSQKNPLPYVVDTLRDGTQVRFIDAQAHPPARKPGGRGVKSPPRPRPPHSGFTSTAQPTPAQE